MAQRRTAVLLQRVVRRQRAEATYARQLQLARVLQALTFGLRSRRANREQHDQAPQPTPLGQH